MLRNPGGGVESNVAASRARGGGIFAVALLALTGTDFGDCLVGIVAVMQVFESKIGRWLALAIKLNPDALLWIRSRPE